MAVERPRQDIVCNPESLTPFQWSQQAFVVKGLDLLYAREVLYRSLLEADKRSLGMTVKDPLSPNTIKAALQVLGGQP